MSFGIETALSYFLAVTSLRWRSR